MSVVVDETAFRSAREAMASLPCVFAKAILARHAGCELAVRRAIAERESVSCGSPVAHANCVTLHALLRERSTFALKLPRPDERIAHAAEMRLQCGGLKGLRESLAGRAAASGGAATAGREQPPDRHSVPAGAEAPVADVHRLVVGAQARFGSLMDLPFDVIVRAVAQWPARRPGRA